MARSFRLAPDANNVIQLPVEAPDRKILVGMIVENPDRAALLLNGNATLFETEIYRDGASHGVGIIGPFMGMQHLPMRTEDTILAGVVTLPETKGILTVFGASRALVIIPDLVH